MFCPKCGNQIADNSAFCPNCGAALSEQAPVASAPVQTATKQGSKDKLVAGLLALFLGTMGIHKFYLGYTKSGVIMLLVSLLTFGVGAAVMAVIALIEGILYLTKSDEEFYNTYEANEKQWF